MFLWTLRNIFVWVYYKQQHFIYLLLCYRVWDTVYFSRSEGAIKDNEATFFNISICGGIKGDQQPKKCTSSLTSVCMRSSDNAMFALADTASCDVTYNSTKRHVQFVYKYSSTAQSTFHNGTVMITLICGQHFVSTATYNISVHCNSTPYSTNV